MITDHNAQDELIDISLTCLLSCVETMRAQASGYLNMYFHGTCKSSRCAIECISELEFRLQPYVDEFSKVIFRKQNLQNDREWWLSMFYSLCIQSIVRKGLIAIAKSISPHPKDPTLPRAKFYLPLAHQLFFASAATYDPLVSNWNTIPNILDLEHLIDLSYILQYSRAQSAVKQHTWRDRNINGSREYLEELFEAKGAVGVDVAPLESEP